MGAQYRRAAAEARYDLPLESCRSPLRKQQKHADAAEESNASARDQCSFRRSLAGTSNASANCPMTSTLAAFSQRSIIPT
jgi:hypothetical protein